MPITEILTKNVELYKNDVSLVEINPQNEEGKTKSWREYSLVEPSQKDDFRSEITWGEFGEKANRFANLLLSRGVRKGDRVAILLTNCLEWLPIYFGILETGAVAVPLNYRYTADEIKYSLEIAEVKVLVFGPEFIGRVEEIFDEINDNINFTVYLGDDCPSFAESYGKLTADCSSRAPIINITDSDEAAIYFSSGTTGRAKAILHNHESLVHACVVEQKHHFQTKDDVFLLIPPLYHTGAKMHWFGSFLVGGKAVILRGVDPELILRTVSEEKCTIVWLTVPWTQDILCAIENGDIDLNNYELSQWRLIHIGAQPVPPSLVMKWKKYFPNHQYDTNYGLSESIGPGCVHLGVENIHKVGAIGKAGYGWETKIVDKKGQTVKRGEIGELAVKGPGLMTCYYNDEKATAESLRDGWLFTGDVAKEDEDGFIFLVDRKKDVIIMGGENLYPVQIEDFMRKHNAIKDVAVIGVPDSRLGEIPIAVVELKKKNSVTEEELIKFCEGLPRYKRPRKIVLAKIPRNPTGKIEKPKLREMYGGEKLIERQTQN